MFPPVRTDNHETWLENMLTSLERAGLEFSHDIKVDKNGSAIEVKVRLLYPIRKADWPALNNYIMSYSARSGWVVWDLRQNNVVLTFTASSD